MSNQIDRIKARQLICDIIAEGGSAQKAAEAAGISKSLIFYWLRDDPEFADQYTRAREARADARAERIDDICQDVRSGLLRPDAARVIIDAEKWQAGKENAKRYGERLQVDGDIAVKMTDAQLNARITQLLGKAGINSPADRGVTSEGEA